MLQDDYVKVNGVRLHYVTSGTGPLILFLHGFPEFWYAWKNQLADFASDYQAVALDMRGFNLSDKPSDIAQYRLDILDEDIRAFAAHLSPAKKFVLVGHDWGGFVAWAFAAAHPHALEKLVIINAPHPAVFARLLTSDPAQQKASEYMEIFRSPQADCGLQRAVLLVAVSKPAHLYASRPIPEEYGEVLSRPELRIRQGSRQQLLGLSRTTAIRCFRLGGFRSQATPMTISS